MTFFLIHNLREIQLFRLQKHTQQLGTTKIGTVVIYFVVSIFNFKNQNIFTKPKIVSLWSFELLLRCMYMF